MSKPYERAGNVTAIIGVILLAPLFFSAYRAAVSLPVGDLTIVIIAGVIGLILVAAGWGGKR